MYFHISQYFSLLVINSPLKKHIRPNSIYHAINYFTSMLGLGFPHSDFSERTWITPWLGDDAHHHLFSAQ